MTEEKDIALIEGYLQGELDHDTRTEVEERLDSDTAFRQLYEDVQLLGQGIEGMQHRGLLQSMDALESGLDNPLAETRETKTIYWTFSRLAAAFVGIAVVALASWYIVSSGPVPTGPELYAEYYQIHPNSMVPTTRAEADTTLLTRAFQRYDQQAYAEAGALFDELLPITDREYVRFYAGLTFLEAGRQQEGRQVLNEVIETAKDFQDFARWYLALDYIKNEEYDKSKPLLEALTTSQSSFAERAKELHRIIR